jgi:MFS family permease
MSLTQKHCYPWLLVVLLSLMGICFPAAVTQFSMVTNELAGVMDVPRQTVLLADTMRAVCLVTGMFLSSAIYSKLGLRRTILLGVFFQVGSQFLVPVAVTLHNLPLFFAFKAMQGLNAIAFPLYLAVITQWITPSASGLATAIFNGSFSAGAGVGAWVVGKIVPAFGWRASFYIVGCMCLVTAIPVLLVVRENPAFHKLAEGGAAQDKPTGRVGYADILRKPVTWMLVITLVANTWVTQAVTVDLSVYAQEIGYSYGQAGNLMLCISVITVVSSILGGAVSDYFASKSPRPLRARSIVLLSGYVLSAVAAVALPATAGRGIAALSLSSCAMMFGASWSAGVFWALPGMVYSPRELVSATSFCSGASNVPNPIAPAVVGVLLGTSGHWTAGWFTCGAASVLSVVAALYIASLKTVSYVEGQQ